MLLTTKLTAAALLALALAGCRTPLDWEPGPVDAAVPPDLAPPPRCPTHFPTPTPLRSIDALDFQGFQREGAALRVGATYQLRGCDVAGPLRATVSQASATEVTIDLQLLVHRGAGDAACTKQIISTTRHVVLSDLVAGVANKRVLVRDVAPGATQTLVLTPGAAAPAACTDTAALADPCRLDCQCAARNPLARCVPTEPDGGRCAIPCTEDVDCPDEVPFCASAGEAIQTCQPRVDACRCALAFGSCPFNQTCKKCLCILDGDDAPSSLAACACDADCRANEICSARRCVRPCAVDAQCPACTRCEGETGCRARTPC